MGGKYDYFECGNTSRFRNERAVYIAKMKRFEENGKCRGVGNVGDKKGKIDEVNGKNNG